MGSAGVTSDWPVTRRFVQESLPAKRRDHLIDEMLWTDARENFITII